MDCEDRPSAAAFLYFQALCITEIGRLRALKNRRPKTILHPSHSEKHGDCVKGNWPLRSIARQESFHQELIKGMRGFSFF